MISEKNSKALLCNHTDVIINIMLIESINFSLLFFAFCAGLVDATVGGGGLILVPALLYTYPNSNIASIFGTNKVVALASASSSAFGFIRRVDLPWRLILPTMLSAFLFAYLGAISVSIIPKTLMQYAVFILLIGMAIYTFIKKELGQVHQQVPIGNKQVLLGIFFGALIGFYDGIFGPGSGSFFLFLFIKVFCFDFIHAVASAKLLNIATFIAALIFFIPEGHVIWSASFYMILSAMLGAFVGTQLAFKYGSAFIRFFFLLLLLFLIGRMGYQLFF